jgi:hypothetical protein
VPTLTPVRGARRLRAATICPPRLIAGMHAGRHEAAHAAPLGRRRPDAIARRVSCRNARRRRGASILPASSPPPRACRGMPPAARSGPPCSWDAARGDAPAGHTCLRCSPRLCPAPPVFDYRARPLSETTPRRPNSPPSLAMPGGLLAAGSGSGRSTTTPLVRFTPDRHCIQPSTGAPQASLRPASPSTHLPPTRLATCGPRVGCGPGGPSEVDPTVHLTTRPRRASTSWALPDHSGRDYRSALPASEPTTVARTIPEIRATPSENSIGRSPSRHSSSRRALGCAPPPPLNTRLWGLAGRSRRSCATRLRGDQGRKRELPSGSRNATDLLAVPTRSDRSRGRGWWRLPTRGAPGRTTAPPEQALLRRAPPPLLSLSSHHGRTGHRLGGTSATDSPTLRGCYEFSYRPGAARFKGGTAAKGPAGSNPLTCPPRRPPSRTPLPAE